MTTTGAVRLADICELIREPVRPGAWADSLYLGLEHLIPGRLVRTGGGQASYMRTSWARIREFEALDFAPDEQRGISEPLWLAHELISHSEPKSAVLAELSKALLHKLMTGEVRVGELGLARLKEN